MVVGSSGYGECREDQGRLGFGGNETGSNMWSAMLYVWYVHVKPEYKAIQLCMFYNNISNLAFYSFIHIFCAKMRKKHISTSIQSVQHAHAVQKIQQVQLTP